MTLVKAQTAGSHPRGSDSVVLAWDPVYCMSNKLPGDADEAHR